MTGERIKFKKAQAIYDILVKLVAASDDYYEKETFLYHHSICQHDMDEYILTTTDHFKDKLIWVFKTGGSEIRLDYVNFTNLTTSEISEALITKMRANRIIQYILEKGG